MASDSIRFPIEHAFLAAARRAILATTDPSGSPRLVPICFAIAAPGDPDGDPGAGPVLYSPIDEKPKATTDPLALARVQDLVARPAVVVLVDRWDEDWTRLAWLRLRGLASLMEPGNAEHVAAVAGLRAKYPQYAGHRLEARPIVRIAIEQARSWGDLTPDR